MTRSFHGSPPFPEGAKTALRNPQLRANMAGATTTIRSKRDRVVAELQSWEDLRLSGEAIKTSALEHLDELLCALEARITEAGGVVHWANDAAEANRLIVGLVAATGYDEVVKVKSMTTAEIGLNQALESAGITAYETDLAELIVQLGDDLPSHIVVPAIHRSRQEIRKTFVDHMGEWGHPAPAGLSTEPGDLAAAARVHLRHRFLSAKVAICGANFLVAETGAIVIVESEGNGRMCVTLPETLIAVAGIDKVIPSWEDLDVFLQVLPRSATGERMNPYTSVWTGVRPGDGPQQYHLVLVDNGRSRALADPVGRQALRCIRCAACLNVCPVYERVGGHAYGSVYPGPIGAVLTPQLDQVATDDVAASLPYASTLCGACFDACPVRIDIPRLLVHLRAEVVDAQRETPNPNQERAGMALASWALARPRRLDFLARVGTIASRVLRNRPIRLPGWAGGWSATRAVPLPREDSFASWWRRTHPNEIAGDRFATIVSHRAGGPRPRWRRLRRPGGRIPLGASSQGTPVALGPNRAPRPPASNRNQILERIADALPSPREPTQIPRNYRGWPTDRPDIPGLFAERLRDYKASVTEVHPDKVVETLAALLAVHRSTSVVVPSDFPDHWRPARPGTVIADDRTLSIDALNSTDTVLTLCKVAIAETGTVVLDGGPGQGRRAVTLLPDHHIVIVKAEQIVANVPDALSVIDRTAPQTWISGPSATSDIELQRVEGVHGPRVLDVVIVTGG